MRGLLRKLGTGLAVMLLAGASAVAAAAPTDEPVRQRSVRIDPPFVPAVDIDSVPGYRKTMRGDRIAYCRTERKIGTRFKTEVCIDQAQMPAYLAALEEQRRELKRMHSGEYRIN